MSRWSPDRIFVLLGRRAVALSRRGREPAHWQASVLEEPRDVPPWQGAVQGLHDALAQPAARGVSELHVFLEADFLRYQIIPWQNDFARPAARRAYVQHCFAQTFGENSRQWQLLESPGRFGHAAFAAGVDSALLGALDQTARERQLRLRSVMPALVPAFNACAIAVATDSFWFVWMESERMTLVLSRRNEPVTVRVAPRDPDQLAMRLDREWNALGLIEAPCVVFCGDATGPARLPNGLGRWRVESLALPPILRGFERLAPINALRAA